MKKLPSGSLKHLQLIIKCLENQDITIDDGMHIDNEVLINDLGVYRAMNQNRTGAAFCSYRNGLEGTVRLPNTAEFRRSVMKRNSYVHCSFDLVEFFKPEFQKPESLENL